MEENLLTTLVEKTKATNAMLVMLLTIVAGLGLQVGVTGLLWLVCWIATVYGLVVISIGVVMLSIGAFAYLVQGINFLATLAGEDARMKQLNDIYNRVNKK